ncbi:hypothetical protein [Massilia sp. TN1-12]|uniref:hypothetical protein n=1 Tax=Massilia paldalensis TaxID=3377675 RepID=UPI00384B3A99
MMQTLITEHTKKPGRGWQMGRQAPANDPSWSPADRAWINTLMETGDDVITVGDTMYQAQWVKDAK